MADGDPIPPTLDGVVEALRRVPAFLDHIVPHLEEPTRANLECVMAHLADLSEGVVSWAVVVQHHYLAACEAESRRN